MSRTELQVAASFPAEIKRGFSRNLRLIISGVEAAVSAVRRMTENHNESSLTIFHNLIVNWSKKSVEN